MFVTWFVEFTAAPVSLTTWSMPPLPLRNTVKMSCSFTPEVSGTSKPLAEWIDGPNRRFALTTSPGESIGAVTVRAAVGPASAICPVPAL